MSKPSPSHTNTGKVDWLMLCTSSTVLRGVVAYGAIPPETKRNAKATAEIRETMITKLLIAPKKLSPLHHCFDLKEHEVTGHVWISQIRNGKLTR
jgi:hypothetical protein